MRKNQLLLLVTLIGHEIAVGKLEIHEEFKAAFDSLKAFKPFKTIRSLLRACHVLPLRTLLRQLGLSLSWARFVIPALRRRRDLPLERGENPDAMTEMVMQWLLKRDFDPEKAADLAKTLRRQASLATSQTTRKYHKRAASILESYARSQRKLNQYDRSINVRRSA